MLLCDSYSNPPFQVVSAPALLVRFCTFTPIVSSPPLFLTQKGKFKHECPRMDQCRLHHLGRHQIRAGFGLVLLLPLLLLLL